MSVLSPCTTSQLRCNICCVSSQIDMVDLKDFDDKVDARHNDVLMFTKPLESCEKMRKSRGDDDECHSSQARFFFPTLNNQHQDFLPVVQNGSVCCMYGFSYVRSGNFRYIDFSRRWASRSIGPIADSFSVSSDFWLKMEKSTTETPFSRLERQTLERQNKRASFMVRRSPTMK